MSSSKITSFKETHTRMPKTSQPFTIEHALLGLVRQHPLHGYEIYQRLKTHPTLNMIWNPKQSQVYAMLKKLEQAGFLVATVETQEAYPPRRVLRLTDEGAVALTHWFSRPVRRWEDVQREFPARLFFAQSSIDDTAHNLVEQQRSVSRTWLTELQQRMRSLTACQSSEWLLIQLRMHQVQGFLNWLDHCLVYFSEPVFVVHTIAALQDSPQPALAQRFVDYVCSAAGQAILEQYGFLPASESAETQPALHAPADLTIRHSTAEASLTVFAAATLKDAFQALAYAFSTAHGGCIINLTCAGSHYLADEIARGAPVDVFASANRKLMAPVIQAGRMATGSERIFVRNRLLVITGKHSPVQLSTLHDLAQPGLKIALGSRSTAIGHYALEMLAKAEQHGSLAPTEREAVLHNVAFYEQDVRAVLSRVVGGEADVAIVYTSDYYDPAGGTAASLVYPLEELWLQSG
jgi:molybdenum ABC transporter molybdate-binding protein